MTAIIVNSTQSIDTAIKKVGSNGVVVLRGGTYHQTLSPNGTQRLERGVSLIAYPGEIPVIDGTNEGPNALYTNSWEVNGVTFQNFASKNNGVIAQVGSPLNNLGLSLYNVRFINCTTIGDSTAHCVYVTDPGNFYANGLSADRAAGSVIQFYTVPSTLVATVEGLRAANADQAILLWDSNTLLNVSYSLFVSCRIPIRGHLGKVYVDHCTGILSGSPLFDGAVVTQTSNNWSAA